MTKVCLVGAGNISHVHAEAIKNLPNLRLNCVVDPNVAAAKALAATWNIPHVFASAAEALASGEVDRVHVLTPPDLHAATALPFLEAGKATLLEKPLAVSPGECETLKQAAARGGAVLGVNQNFVHHPAFVRLRQTVDERRLGRPTFIDCLYNVPLRQMAAKQFGHWMFAEPGNILLEQAVHPLSQIVALSGRLEAVVPMAGPAIEISPGVPFFGEVGMMMRGERVPAQMRMAVGQSFPFWQISVVCDDGVAVADILNNRFYTFERTLWLDFYDALLSGRRTGRAILRDSLANARDYLLQTAKLKPRCDGFYLSILGSARAFHGAVDQGRTPELDANFGAHLVEICDKVAKEAFTATASPRPVRTEGDYDVAVLGGTGFIGTHVVKTLLAKGYRVGVMARNVRNLDAVFLDERVVVIRGDVRRDADVEKAVGAAKIVVNLAHGGGGRNYDEIRTAMVGSAERVARVCLERKVERLIHVGSIASLYLGDPDSTVTGSTAPDSQPELRADYARAKVECDKALMALRDKDGLPLCILRPGVVVGEGGVANHTGLGFFNNDQFCVGWNDGLNPLPFVLVEDVAEAVALACSAKEAVGKSYNLVGDVRLSARDYIAELGRSLQRPIGFSPKSGTVLWLQEVAKWLVKRAAGRKVAMPALRDIRSRGLVATFDCADIKQDLGWRPVADTQQFVERGIRVYAR